ncbi:MAG: Zn-dependent hydrolase [Gammaproteobacteria bacterium]|nr:MAG: Zn-dependent hydrolase [Gammaproteobacteria bacterium]
MPFKINFQRLQDDIDKLSQIGRADDHGIYRMAFSDADMEARNWLLTRIEQAGLTSFIDEAANIHARHHWDDMRPSVITGSHIDTVPGAGPLDGAMGVLAGLECLRRIKEENLQLAFPLECIAFSDEEGRFGGMLGSQAISGQLTPGVIFNARDMNGVMLSDACTQRGYPAQNILRAQRRPDSIHAYVELHIEQGPVLDRHSLSIGLVDAIAGLLRWNIRLIGEANHAGTTPMDMRRDALQGFAEVATSINRILAEYGSPRSTATIGRVETIPGAANVVPGQVNFSLDMRDTSMKTLEDLSDAFRRAIAAIARRHQLMFEFDVVSQLDAAQCDAGILDVITDAANQLNLEHMTLHSGAAHDAQMMARIARTAMIFVPSKSGKSHSPAEWTSWEDIEKGANVLLNTLIKLTGAA